jgi:PAS domain S-box-containing protein
MPWKNLCELPMPLTTNKQTSRWYYTILFVVLPIVFIAGILVIYQLTSFSMRNTHIENLKDHARFENSLLANRTESLLDSLSNQLLLIQEQAALADLTDPEVFHQFTRTLRRLVISESIAAGAAVVDASGSTRYSTERGRIPDEKLIRILNIAHNEQLFKHYFHISPESEMLAMSVSLTNVTGDPLFCVVEIDKKVFFSALDTMETLGMVMVLLTDQHGETEASWRTEDLSDAAAIVESEKRFAGQLQHELRNARPTAITGAQKLFEDDAGIMTTVKMQAYPLYISTLYDKETHLLSWKQSFIRNMIMILILGVGILGVSLLLRSRILHTETLRRKMVSQLEVLVLERTAELREKSAHLEAENLAHRKTEAALRESEIQYRNLIASSPDAIFINYQDRVVLVNTACLSLFGAEDESQLIGKHVLDLFHPSFQENVRSRIEQMRSKGQAVPPLEELVLRLDGTAVAVETVAAPFAYRGEKAIHVILRDITARKQLEEQYRQAQKLDSIGQLAGGIAHDFNNMLGIMLGYAELALEQVPPESEAAASVREIQKAANRSSNLTRQLLGFARRQTIVPRTLNLNKLVEDLFAVIRSLTKDDIDLQWYPGDDLWKVYTDAGQIDQVLINILINSRDAIEGVGKITLETGNIEIDSSYTADHLEAAVGRYVMIAVSDDGSGMDEATRKHIFDPFFTTKKQGAGTGLGLAMVYGVIRQNMGFINIYSELGKGTTVKIYLPATDRDASVTEEDSSDTDASGTVNPDAGNFTILLVEDDPSLLRLNADMLIKLGYRVLASPLPEEALEIADAHRGELDLLITDVIMPQMNGRILSEELLKRYPDMQCLFVSGYTANVIAHHGILDAGINFIQKPFNRKTLAAAVAKILNISS